MSRVCTQCGNILEDNETFCSRCGSNQPIIQPATTYQQTPQQPTYQSYAVPQPAMTTGQWVGTIILTTWFGIISFILCIVWGFSESTPEPKKSYCKATFIISLIGIGIGILFIIIYSIFIASVIGSISDVVSDYSNYSYSF